MTTLVLDASVIVKWIFPERPHELHTSEALQILRHLRAARLTVKQPPHWLAEVAAVAARLEPRVVRHAVGLLYALELPVVAEAEMYQRGCELAVELRQHVFDTLYHAVALVTPDALLVTADDLYYRRAHVHGRIVRLKEVRLS